MCHQGLGKIRHCKACGIDEQVATGWKTRDAARDVVDPLL
jgi:hypothetical protein